MTYRTPARRNRRNRDDSFAMVLMGAFLAMGGAFLFGSAIAPIWNLDVYGCETIRNALAFTDATFLGGGTLIAFAGAVTMGR